ERIAHLGTPDCCVHPPGRNEMIAVTPPIIFSKEVAQKQATPFSARTFSPPEIVSDQISGDGAWMNFQFSRVLPPPGGPPTPTLAAGAAASRPRWQPPSVDHDALPAFNCARNVLCLVTRPQGGEFYHDEIKVQETHTKHRKLDSQAVLPHSTRDRAADGLRPKAWPLRPSRRDHDPCRLSP